MLTYLNIHIKGGESIGRIIILELTERDSSAFEDILSFLSRHPDLKKWELRDEPMLSLPGLEINLARRKITSNGQAISLTAKEYDIFCLLVANNNRVLTYDQIYEKVWGDFSSGSERETIGFHVRNLRKKLFDTDQEPAYQIESIRDVGYRFQYN
ncbi:DNA-binding response regulator mtrA [uncultured Ruminococcus sp.]|nr:DNA-binding response regulator mtrA [uncultured Ruminococcus sp.]